MTKRYLISLFFLTVFVGCTAQAQLVDSDTRSLTINITASETLPADLILFNINVNAEASSPQEAFRLHKQRESLLAGLIKNFNIPEEKIRFQPIRINKGYSNQREQTVQTSQQVSLSFSDFGIYEKIQLSLIENNFDSFNGSFSSSKLTEGKERALEKAILSATEKAKSIARSSGVQLGEIKQINYSEFQEISPVSARSAGMEMMLSSDSSMMDFSQTVQVNASITIVFAIGN